MSAQAINSRESQIPEPNISRVLFADTRLAPVWLLIRFYLGALWLVAGWEKLTDPAGLWVGSKAGAAVAGFAQGAIAQTTGEHPQVTGWYASFLKDVVVPNAALFSYLVTFGEVLVGLGLIFGFLGLLCAVPLLAASVVAVKMLYVQDVVGEPVEVFEDLEDD